MNAFEISNLKPILKGKRILLGITGSIAAFKACDIVRFLKQCGAEVRVVLSASAEKFVTPLTLETLSGERVLTSLWNNETSAEIGTHHISLARWADLFLIAPATANILAKIAHGLADDLLSTELLAFKGPILIAPAMNPAMYLNPAVQANVAVLSQRNIQILTPEKGITSCGEEGIGRMQEPAQILYQVAAQFFAPQNGKTLLLTTGPTRSYLDPIRYLSNRSSGKMGSAIAWAALQQGYKVISVTGPTQISIPIADLARYEEIKVTTAEEMANAALSRWSESHIFVGTAAVLDWDISQASDQKLKKERGAPRPQFKKNRDILAEVCEQRRPDQFVLGFAAETEQLVPNAIKKRHKKRCNAVFVNEVGAENQGFESDENTGFWVSDKIVQIPKYSKAMVAQRLLQLIESEIEERNSLPRYKNLEKLKTVKEIARNTDDAETHSEHL